MSDVKAVDTNLTDLLRQALPNLRDEDIVTLSRAAHINSYPAGTELTREGEEGHTFFVLAEGNLDILVRTSDGRSILVDHIHPPAYFGEMAFFGESVRMATIRAQTPCRTLEIDEEDFMRVAQGNPKLLQSLLQQIIGHLRRNDRAIIREVNAKNEELEKAYADLSEQESLRSRFITTLSHEFRTPLTSIQGFINLISQGAIQGDSLKAAMHSIGRNVERLVGLTNDMLVLYEMHPTRMDFEYINVADVVVDALNITRSRLSVQPTAITLDINSDLPEVYADARALSLALQAIMENAFKFDPKKRPVLLRVYTKAVENGREGPHVAIDVIDQGVGVPDAEQQRIFEPFYRLESEGGAHLFPGLGIGLTLARFVVERHEGQILIDSQPGQGSTFTVLLPSGPGK
ncbi:MAG: HAMP domain-containing sensor histidine kinase [Chloroflexota bacterium]|jgi:signal transduction histidine kinase